jgi:hypothetical protein
VNYQPKSAERCAIVTPKSRDESGTFVPNGGKKGPLRDLFRKQATVNARSSNSTA